MKASPTDLETILVNLLVNARDAIVCGRGARTSEAQGRISLSVAPNERSGQAIIRIRDTGGGIPADVMPRIFDPFFTTKEVGMGMGLGLSIVHATIANLGGRLDVRNVPGGAVFEIALPLAETA